MKKNPADEILSAIRDPHDRLRVWGVLDALRGQTVYFPMRGAPEKVSHAEHLLAEGFEPREVVAAIANKFDCSARTAQRAVKKARQAS